ncbi:hypothetical protein AHAS_Ahas01G0203800 [Arachis hypogaea]
MTKLSLLIKRKNKNKTLTQSSRQPFSLPPFSIPNSPVSSPSFCRVTLLLGVEFAVDEEVLPPFLHCFAYGSLFLSLSHFQSLSLSCSLSHFRLLVAENIR